MSVPVVDLGALSPVERAALAAQLQRESMRDKGYTATPLGEDVAAFLAAKRQRFSENTLKAYESSLDKLARHFADLRLEDFEPPIGTERITEYLDRHWGTAKGSTYNMHRSATSTFFEFWQVRGRLHGDPMRGIDRARKEQLYREIFSDDERLAIIATASLRDRIALRLLFDYGLRRGALKAVQFRHFDHQRRWLTIFTKGAKVRQLRIPDTDLWMELERHILEAGAQGEHFLMCVRRPIPRAGWRDFPEREMSTSTIHNWFKRVQLEAGIKEPLHLHAARHTAAQRVLDATGNIVAVQKLLGHSSIATTQEYVGMGEDELAQVMVAVLARDAR